MPNHRLAAFLDKLGPDRWRRRSRRRRELAGIADHELYQPLFSPWLAQGGEFRRCYAIAAPRTLVSADRCHVL